MSSFERVWAGNREVRPRAAVPALDEPVVMAFRAWTRNLMSGVESRPTPRSLDLRKLRLTEGYREALRQAPGAQTALFGIWDMAYRVLEHLHWELAPPAIDPPAPAPAPDFEAVRRQYKAMKRERAERAEARTIHWHPLEITNQPADEIPDDRGE